MQKITLDEFCAHWVREREKGGWDPFLPSRLAGNTFDFATEAGQYSRRQFLASFPSGGFCGGTWTPRTSRWGRKFTHPVMNDTGALAAGIKGEADRTDIRGAAQRR